MAPRVQPAIMETKEGEMEARGSGAAAALCAHTVNLQILQNLSDF